MRGTLADAIRGSGLLVAPLVLVAAGAAAWALPSQMQVIVGFFITVVLVAALQIFSGNSGIVSFAHVGFMGVGAYVAALTSIPASIKQSQLPGLPHWLATLELGFLPSVAVAVVVTASLGALLGGVLVRMREDAIAVATISVLFILYTVFRNWDQVTQGALGLYGIPRSTTVWWAVTSAAVAIGAALCFRASRVGLQLRASSADALAAQTLGAHVARLRWLAWVASVAVMGLGGAVWAHFNIAFGPSQFFLPLTLTLLAMVTIGGLQSVSGVVAGAMVVTAIGELMRRLEDRVSMPGLTQIAVALLILAVLTWRPMGLVGPIELHHRIGKGRRRT